MINPHPKPFISIIVAMDEQRAIGRNNDLLWHLSADLRHFKHLTMGHTVVMGRRTWESLPKRPLPGRRNIVLSQSDTFAPEGAETAHSANQLLDMLPRDEEVFVMGGAKIYELLLPFADRLYVTHVHHTYPEADVFFPVIDRSEFNLVHEDEPTMDEPSGLVYHYAEYDRKFRL